MRVAVNIIAATLFIYWKEKVPEGIRMKLSKNAETNLSLAVGGIIVLSMLFLAKEVSVYTAGSAKISQGEQPCVVIDAGHGGRDPGKVAVNGLLEKDINLAIAQKLQMYLEENNITVIMTREGEEGLYDEETSNKKVQDMKRRIAIMEECNPTVIISIHQNSYSAESVNGFQAFYYEGSGTGKEMAGLLQESVIKRTEQKSKRQIKANDSYYLLKKTSLPVVIAECGFLSNKEEAEKLSTSDYQDRMAWCLYIAIMQCLNQNN